MKKIKVKINVWDNVSQFTTKEEIKNIEIWEDTKEEIFKKFDKKNNKLKYCNSYLCFEDEKIFIKYKNWYKSLSRTTQLNMYYGNGTVD